MCRPIGALSIVGMMIVGAAASPSPGQAQADCLKDSELKLLGLAVGDPRQTVRKRVGPAVSVSKDTVAGMDFIFDVTRYRTSRMEVVVSDATGRAAELIPLDTSLSLPRSIRLGMSLDEVRRRLAPADLAKGNDGLLTVSGCGPRGSGMDLRFDERSRLTWVSLTGYYPPDN